MSIPKIGESEWYVMKALWDSAPLSGSDVVRAVSRYTDWSPSTRLTMLRRLVAKKAVGVEKRDVMMYYPLVEESAVTRAETTQFLNRVYQGSVKLLIKNFIEEGALSEQERAELKKLLDEMR
ncbi:MAG: BlaI/MecI/CopY family transcriptional regulator [Christensenellaceae bacterium]|nr:BlaI/MecI/CopY family transcriptional regulator [Christensenellaceae bacterium]